MSGFLILAYPSHYAPMPAPRAQPKVPPVRGVSLGLGLAAAAFGFVISSWVGLLVFRHFGD